MLGGSDRTKESRRDERDLGGPKNFGREKGS